MYRFCFIINWIDVDVLPLFMKQIVLFVRGRVSDVFCLSNYYV